MSLNFRILCFIVITITGSCCDLVLSAPAPSQGEFVLPKERRSRSPASADGEGADAESENGMIPGAIHHLNADNSNSEQGQGGQELKGLYSSPMLVPRYYSWDPAMLEQGGRSNLANGFKSSALSLLPSDWNSNWNRGGNENSFGIGAGAGLLENELSGGSRVSRNPSSAHEPLGTLLSQWNFKLLHPLNLPLSSGSDERTQKRNSNYMCHFKLCQLGASGKRKWNPSTRYLNDPSVAYN